MDKKTKELAWRIATAAFAAFAILTAWRLSNAVRAGTMHWFWFLVVCGGMTVVIAILDYPRVKLIKYKPFDWDRFLAWLNGLVYIVGALLGLAVFDLVIYYQAPVTTAEKWLICVVANLAWVILIGLAMVNYFQKARFRSKSPATAPPIRLTGLWVVQGLWNGSLLAAVGLIRVVVAGLVWTAATIGAFFIHPILGVIVLLIGLVALAATAGGALLRMLQGRRP